jgi:small subunit ribosomal protein S4
LLQLLERRLDAAVFRMGFAANRRGARQLVKHGHFLVNGRSSDIPSHLLKPGDVVAVKESSRENPTIVESLSVAEHRGIPDWIQFDAQGRRGTFVRIPARDEIQLPVQEQLIVELYSK